MQKQFEQDAEKALFKDVEYDPVSEDFESDERVDFMVPIDQVRFSRRAHVTIHSILITGLTHLTRLTPV